jgi:hypothetical protein
VIAVPTLDNLNLCFRWNVSYDFTSVTKSTITSLVACVTVLPSAGIRSDGTVELFIVIVKSYIGPGISDHFTGTIAINSSAGFGVFAIPVLLLIIQHGKYPEGLDNYSKGYEDS